MVREISSVKSPCGLCREYTAQLCNYIGATKNDEKRAKALRGALTVVCVMLAETPDPETAELLERYPVACREWEDNFCIYRKAEIEAFAGRLEEAREKIQELQDQRDKCVHLQKILYELQERFKK